MMNKEEQVLGSMEEMKRRILDVKFKMNKEEQVLESDDDDHDSWESEEEVQEEKRQWESEEEKEKQKKEKEEKERKEKEEKEKEENLKRQWDDLPSTALLNIFCKCELKDRLQSIPLVCKSWKSVTDHPCCWSSMIPDSVSPEDAFIKKKRGYRFPRYHLPRYNIKLEEVARVAVSRLRTLIKKSGGGAAITTLYLEPFFPYLYRDWGGGGIDETYDEIIHLIANCCPNLKHISFDVNGHTSKEAVLRLFNKCKKLELIELLYHRNGEFEDEEPIYLKWLESLSCLPHLYGFHFDGSHYFTTIATHLPRLKLLRLDCRPLYHEDLSFILFSCLELQYLYVPVDPQLYYNQDIIDQASVQIPEFKFDYKRDHRYYTPSDHDNYSVLDDYSHYCFEDHGFKETDHASRIVDEGFRTNDDFRIDEYRDILK